jgi:hypothetical protein
MRERHFKAGLGQACRFLNFDSYGTKTIRKP